MPKRVRMSPEGRREVIIKAAIALTREADGCIDSWSRQDVACKCVPQTSQETVKHYFRCLICAIPCGRCWICKAPSGLRDGACHARCKAVECICHNAEPLIP